MNFNSCQKFDGNGIEFTRTVVKGTQGMSYFLNGPKTFFTILLTNRFSRNVYLDNLLEEVVHRQGLLNKEIAS